MTLKQQFKYYLDNCIEGGYVIDETNKISLANIFRVFEANVRGACVTGGTGAGKSIIFKALKRILPYKDAKQFEYENCIDIVHEYNTTGDEVFERFNQKKNFYIDDIGIEDNGKFYGKEVNVIEHIIQIRYNVFINTGHVTHFTTNQLDKELKTKYGSRAHSRLNEMCEYIKLNSVDHRFEKRIITWYTVKHEQEETKPDEWITNWQQHRLSRMNMNVEDMEEEARIEGRKRLTMNNNDAFKKERERLKNNNYKL